MILCRRITRTELDPMQFISTGNLASAMGRAEAGDTEAERWLNDQKAWIADQARRERDGTPPIARRSDAVAGAHSHCCRAPLNSFGALGGAGNRFYFQMPVMASVDEAPASRGAP
jgi:hypothetical protein